MKYDEIEILLVEDNHSDAELALRALKKHNLANNLYWAKDGAEALDFVYARGEFAGKNIDHIPRVILLDLRLPKIDGLEVLKQLKSDELTKMIPVVVLTSSKEERDIVESYKLGVNSFISKPVEFDAFFKVVSDMGLYWLLLNKAPR
jgi:two-component system response regulator